jgi:hypothetical protein
MQVVPSRWRRVSLAQQVQVLVALPLAAPDQELAGWAAGEEELVLSVTVPQMVKQLEVKRMLVEPPDSQWMRSLQLPPQQVQTRQHRLRLEVSSSPSLR